MEKNNRLTNEKGEPLYTLEECINTFVSLSAKEILDMSELCAYLHLTRNTIYRYIRIGVLKPLRAKVGNKLYFERSEIRRFCGCKD